jgi:hypothetical protein
VPACRVRATGDGRAAHTASPPSEHASSNAFGDREPTMTALDFGGIAPMG